MWLFWILADIGVFSLLRHLYIVKVLELLGLHTKRKDLTVLFTKNAIKQFYVITGQ